MDRYYFVSVIFNNNDYICSDMQKKHGELKYHMFYVMPDLQRDYYTTGNEKSGEF